MSDAAITAAPTTDWHPLARPAVAAVLAALIIAITFWAGLQRGMDHMIAVGPQGEQTAITIALTETVYGVHLGYLGLKPVYNKLTEVWNRGISSPSDPKLIDNSHNADLMNEALAAAASLGNLQPGYVADGSLITTFHDDMGQVDFDKLAFRLFGLRIQAFYYLFFTLLAVSAVVFVFAFRDNTLALATLLCVLFAFLVEMHLNVFNRQIPTFAGLRHGSTLGLVPMWYFVFLLGRRFSFTTFIGALIQLAILILAWRIRGSVTWMLILVMVVYAGAGAYAWWHRGPAARDWPNLVRAVVKWPLVMLVVAMAANGAYNRSVLHPVYFSDDVLPYHGLWHSAYIGLALAPELLEPRIQAKVAQRVTPDGFAYYGARDYARRVHFMNWDGESTPIPPGYISPWTGMLKPRLDDIMARGAVIEAWKKNPALTVALYAYRKPLGTVVALGSAFARAPGLTWLWLMIGGTVGIFAFVFSVGRLLQPRQVGVLALAGVATLGAAALPNLWAYPAVYAMIDVILSTVVFVPLTLGTAAAVALRWFLERRRKPGETAAAT